jgi:hypothetical protein
VECRCDRLGVIEMISHHYNLTEPVHGTGSDLAGRLQVDGCRGRHLVRQPTEYDLSYIQCTHALWWYIRYTVMPARLSCPLV